VVKISEEQAREIARNKLGLPAETPGRAWLISRLDLPDAHYWLVALGPPQTEYSLAAVDALDGSLMNWAILEKPQVFTLLTPQEAVRRTMQRGAYPVRLVWQPCQASHSPLYPIWEVQTDERTLYINQQGGVFQELVPGQA
jgi:hypothetical protein